MNKKHQRLLESYLRVPDQLEAALAGLSEEDLDLSKGEGWSIRQVVHHIVSGQMMFSISVKAILGFGDVELPFDWYMDLSQDKWADIWAFDRRPLAPALSGLRGSILDLADLMEHLPDKAWARSGHITFRGQDQPKTIPIEWLIEMIPTHASAHIKDDILAIRKLHGK